MGETIMVRPESFWCAKHLEPFKQDWPVGYLPATLWLLHKAFESKEIVEAAGHDVNRIGAVLDEWGPICCYLGDELVHEATSRALSPDDEVVKKLIRESTGR